MVSSLHSATPTSDPCSVFFLLEKPTHAAPRAALQLHRPQARGSGLATPFAALILDGRRLLMPHQRSGPSLHTVGLEARVCGVRAGVLNVGWCPVPGKLGGKDPLHLRLQGPEGQASHTVTFLMG